VTSRRRSHDNKTRRKIFGIGVTVLQWRTQEFCSGGGVSTNSVEDRKNGDLEAAVIWYKKFHFI